MRLDARLAHVGPDGRPLYRMTAAGNVVRTRKLPRYRRTRVLERDGHRCVWCGSTEWLEVDHVVRYVDGGSNDMDNLRTLCHDCHAGRGSA